MKRKDPTPLERLFIDGTNPEIKAAIPPARQAFLWEYIRAKLSGEDRIELLTKAELRFCAARGYPSAEWALRVQAEADCKRLAPLATSERARREHSAQAQREQGQRYLAMLDGFRSEGAAARKTLRKAAAEAIDRALKAYCAEVGYEVDRERFRQYMRRWKLAAKR